MSDDCPASDEPADRPTRGPWDSVGGHERDRVGRDLSARDATRMRKFLLTLADERRRAALYYLRTEGSAHLEDVAEHVAAQETDAPGGEPAERTVREIRIELYHVHLPKLEAIGAVEHEYTTGQVRLRSFPEGFDRLLEYCREMESDRTIDPERE